jgi:DNA-binding transcriptional regulator LsrR (DeoR family)
MARIQKKKTASKKKIKQSGAVSDAAGSLIDAGKAEQAIRDRVFRVRYPERKRRKRLLL